MATGASHTLGSKVWVVDAELGWVKGDVVKVDKGNLIVSTSKGTTGTYKPEECPLQNPQIAGGVEVSRNAALLPCLQAILSNCLLGWRGTGAATTADRSVY